MKKITVLLVMLLSMSIFSQTWLKIQKTSGGTDSVKLSDIQRLYFTTQSGGTTGSPCPGISTVAYSGETYNTVQVGSQCWLRENLDVGTRINGIQAQSNNGTIEKYCYSDNAANCTFYGGLYSWDEAMQYSTASGTKGICPAGWHIPTMTEFQTLSNTVGGDGNALKAKGQGSVSGTGTNTSGYSALLAGYRNDGGGFGYLGYYAFFWSSTEYGATSASGIGLGNNDGGVSSGNGSVKAFGYSVRCVKD